jgi:hypothetical protein
MLLRQPAAADGTLEPVGATTIQQRSKFPLPGDPSGSAYRIERGNPARSTVVFRMATRNPMRQMPPLGSKVVNEEGLDLIRRWISAMGGDVRLSSHEKEKP